MIAWLYNRLYHPVFPKVNVPLGMLILLTQFLLGAALLALYDAALWATDRRLKRTPSPRTSLPYLLLDYVVFLVMGWYANLGTPTALLVDGVPSLAVFLLVRLTPAVIVARRAAPPEERRHAWRTVIGPGGRILCLIAFVTAALWLLVWIWGLYVVTFINS